jgi:hypothetical protein
MHDHHRWRRRTITLRVFGGRRLFANMLIVINGGAVGRARQRRTSGRGIERFRNLAASKHAQCNCGEARVADLVDRAAAWRHTYTAGKLKQDGRVHTSKSFGIGA